MSKKTIRKMMRSGSVKCPICDCKRPLVEHHIHGRDVQDWSKSWNVLSLFVS